MKQIFCLLSGIVLMVFSIPASASHLLGGTIGWKYLGNDTFLVTATIYRDCNGVPLPTQNLIIFPENARQDTINLTKTGGMNITPVCKKSCSRCGNSSCTFGLGIEEYIFTAKVNLKAIDPSGCNFRIVWEACCYGNVITTGQAGEVYFIDGNINRCLAPHDNSPVFSNEPVMIFQPMQPITLNDAAHDPDIDADGFQDSLVYLLDTAMQAPGVPASYGLGFTFNGPLSYSGKSPNAPWEPKHQGFHLGTATGDLKFMDTQQEISILNILVQEWGKDAGGKPFLKGYIHRNVALFSIADKPDSVPAISGFDGSSSDYDASFCVGQKQCLTIKTFDADSADSVSVIAVIPPEMSSAVFVVDSGAKHPSVKFCWQPDSTHAGKDYQFVINATDNSCPLSGHSSKAFTIHVNKTPRLAGLLQVNNNCGNYRFTATPQPGSGVVKYAWAGDDGITGSSATINHHFRKAGKYNFTISISNAAGCSETFSGNESVPAYVNISASPEDTLICLGKTSALTLSANVSGGTKPYTYTWYADTLQLPDTTPTITKPITKDTLFVAYVTDGSGCTNWDSLHIRASNGTTPVKILPPKDTTACNGTLLKLIASATGGDSFHYYYTWNPAGHKGDEFDIVVSKNQTLTLKVTDGCSADSAIIHINELPPLKLRLSNDTSVCQGEPATLIATGSGGISAQYRFAWDNVLGTGPIKIVKPTKTSTYTVMLSDGCSMPDGGSIKVTVYALPKISFSSQNTDINMNEAALFTNTTSGGIHYLWKFGDGKTSSDTSPAHQYSDTGYYDITLVAYSSEGCTDSLVKQDYIHVKPGFQVFIPGAFTPNEDTINSCFYPSGTEIKSYLLEVYTRWGNKIYSGNRCWDGTFKGEDVMEGMYIYHIKITSTNGIEHSYSNPFYLMR